MSAESTSNITRYLRRGNTDPRESEGSVLNQKVSRTYDSVLSFAIAKFNRKLQRWIKAPYNWIFPSSQNFTTHSPKALNPVLFFILLAFTETAPLLTLPLMGFFTVRMFFTFFLQKNNNDSALIFMSITNNSMTFNAVPMKYSSEGAQWLRVPLKYQIFRRATYRRLDAESRRFLMNHPQPIEVYSADQRGGRQLNYSGECITIAAEYTFEEVLSVNAEGQYELNIDTLTHTITFTQQIRHWDAYRNLPLPTQELDLHSQTLLNRLNRDDDEDEDDEDDEDLDSLDLVDDSFLMIKTKKQKPQEIVENKTNPFDKSKIDKKKIKTL